ncbi:hypothetical protein B566_EDAN016979 [Ephemera danica]|nr:hypothetical protein B566_EDAN016979 [Ephemera danica]
MLLRTALARFVFADEMEELRRWLQEDEDDESGLVYEGKDEQQSRVNTSASTAAAASPSINSKRIHECPHCDKRYRKPHGLKAHILNVHGLNFRLDLRLRDKLSKLLGPPFTCSTCKKSFKHGSHLQYHVESQHGKTTTQPLINNERSFFVFPGSTREKKWSIVSHIYSCPKCYKSYKSLDEVHCHIREQHWPAGNVYYCDLCSKSFDAKKNLNAHLWDHQHRKHKKWRSSYRSNASYVPDVTNHWVFLPLTSRINIVGAPDHSLAVFAIRRSKTSILYDAMGKESSSETSLTVERRSTRRPTSLADYVVQDDDFVTVKKIKKQKLKVANVAVQSDAVAKKTKKLRTVRAVKNFFCSRCDRSKPKRVRVRDPTRTTTRLFSCDECEKSYKYKGDLQYHKRNLHGDLAGPFPCIVCSALFKNRASLRKHMNFVHRISYRHDD